MRAKTRHGKPNVTTRTAGTKPMIDRFSRHAHFNGRFGFLAVVDLCHDHLDRVHDPHHPARSRPERHSAGLYPLGEKAKRQKPKVPHSVATFPRQPRPLPTCAVLLPTLFRCLGKMVLG